jgi:hypothetical protein
MARLASWSDESGVPADTNQIANYQLQIAN